MSIAIKWKDVKGHIASNPYNGIICQRIKLAEKKSGKWNLACECGNCTITVEEETESAVTFIFKAGK